MDNTIHLLVFQKEVALNKTYEMPGCNHHTITKPLHLLSYGRFCISK